MKPDTHKIKPSKDNTIYLPKHWVDELGWDENDNIVIAECFHESNSDKMISELTLMRERDMSIIFPEEIEKTPEEIQQEIDMSESYKAGLLDEEAEA